MPSPRRVRRSIDPRLLIGLVLVAASVAGVVAIVSAADETTEVVVAGAPLNPGDRIMRGDVAIAAVRLDAAAGLYLDPAALPAEGLVVTRSVAQGELVPASAVGAVGGVTQTALVLDVSGALAASVQPTGLVDVWAASEVEGGGFGPPVVIVPGATVVRLVESESMVVGAETTAVEVLVPKDRVARVLEAVANDDAVSIVPATLPAG